MIGHAPSQVTVQVGVFEGALGGNARGAMGRIEQWDKGNRWTAMEANRILTDELELAIRHQFSRHDKTGATMRSMRVRPLLGIGSQITIGGGAAFVEEGTREHVINPKNGGLLVFPWEEAPDGIQRTPNPVMHPGSQRDEFIERAMEETNYTARMQRVAVQAYERWSVMERDYDMMERTAIARAEAWAERDDVPR